MFKFSRQIISKCTSTSRVYLTGGPPLNESLKNVSWLLGKWRSETGKGIYPTIESFTYHEEVEFTHVGQPNLQFTFNASHPETKKPMHRELGFLRVKPGSNKVALIIAQNTGLCEVEEGEVNEQTMTTESHTVGRLSFGKPPATNKIKRTFRREGDTLQQIVEMETQTTKPITQHLSIKYQKID